MFKSSVAWVLNKYLGKYVQDLDTENLNVGIFNGEVQLHDLKLKPEALYELKLPIEVREGLIGTVSLNIPWNGILNQPVVLTIEDVFIVAGAVVGDIFDAELEKRLIRARKKRILDELEEASIFGTDGTSEGLFEKLATNLARNMQIYIRNVHIRYEDTTSIPDSPVSCGLCLQSLSIETTNSKWKPSSTPVTASSTYQLLRVQSLSFYWNSCTHPNGLVLTSGNWRQSMHQGLQSFSINGEDFEFILKPVSAKAKLIITRSNEAKVPKLLLDVVLQDTVVQISRAQYTSMVALQEAFQRIDRNREYREFHPGVHLHKNASLWWKYALNAVMEQRVRPYSWLRIKKHREIYRQYVSAYTLALLRPSDTELKIDLQKLEDQLQIIDLVIAREQAKMQLSKNEPESVILVTSERWWLGLWKCVEPEMKYKMASDSKLGVWGRLTSQEKEKLFELIEFTEGQPTAKPKQYIEHKYNLTLANLSLSLMCHGQEIALASISQFLVSLETRPVASAFKFSARAENFLLEGLSSDNELIPLVQADNYNSDTRVANIFAFDFEKNPTPKEADFSITMRLEPMEIIYNEHTLSELIGFFQTIALKEISEENLEDGINKAREMGMHFLRQKKRVYLNLALKGPTIVIPEQGSIQRGGNVLVIDTGCLKVSTDLQSGPILIEEETKTELEEHLYDRLNFELSGMQIMYCDCSDEWREKRKSSDSDLHLFSGTKIQLMISNSVKPEYKQLPRHKMNLSVSSVKLNLSNRRISSLLDFVDTFPLPAPVSIHSSHYQDTPDHLSCQFLADLVPQPTPLSTLRLIRSTIVMAHLAKIDAESSDGQGLRFKLPLTATEMEKMLSSSDQSDEEIEIWAKTMDQPGFEDNVSPNNTIEILLRLLLGELVINFSKSENKVDVPYLMLRLEKVCVDSALLEYGPAIQFSLGSFQLVDKIHTCAGGCYIELVSGTAPPGFEMLSILYRKVKANCPDFKTHFHSVEHSMVFDMQSLSILFHREAFAAHWKYFNLINRSITKHDSAIGSMIASSMTSIRDTVTTMSTLSLASYFGIEEDPPVPPGSTKLSYSVRVGDVRLRLCNTDIDFLDLKISGFETDCMIKANERTVHRLFLHSVHLEDLSDMTLYSKILFLEGDHLLDVKYVLHSPRLCAKSGIESAKDNIKSDGTLRAHLGRLNVVYLHRFGMDILSFLEPFFDPRAILHLLTSYLTDKLSKMKHFAVKLQLALDMAIPTLLIPQKSDSPNLLILNMGQLKVENFFKWDEHMGTHSVAIDNILAKLDGVQISRAIMTLAGTVEAQEPILEPATLNFDFKRRGNLKVKKSSRSTVAQCQISGSAENIVMNLGQKDLATILLTYQENIAEGLFAELHPKSAQMSPVECCEQPSILFSFQQTDDTPIRKLQTFLGQNQENEAELELSFVVESFELTLFKDIDEVLSSPVRDLQHALCRFELAELSTSMVAAGYGNYTLKSTLQALVLKDIVKGFNILEQKAFAVNSELIKEANKLQPFVECTISKSAAGTWSNEIIVESYTMNLSIQFLANLANFIIESTPIDKAFEGGVVNYGYIGDLTCHRVLNGTKLHSLKCNNEKISVSLQLRQSDINLVSDNTCGSVLCLQSEIVMDYSSEPEGTESCDFMVSRIQITMLEEEQPSQVVLQSCDLEFSKRMQSFAEGIKINISVSPVNFCISSKVAKILCGLAEDVANVTQAKEPCVSRIQSNFQELENLWTPKKIPVCVPCTEDASSYRIQLSPDVKISESLFFSISRISVLFQLESLHKKNPLLQIKSSVTAEIQDWTSQIQLVAQLQLQASYFNESLRKWEPLIEPTNDGSILRPWELSIQLFHAKSFNLSTVSNQTTEQRAPGKRAKSRNSQDMEKSESTMTFIKKQCAEFSGPLGSSQHTRKRHSSSDSDAEHVDQYLNKLSELIGYLVCDDNESESDDSKDEHSDDMHLSDDIEEGHVRKLSSSESRESVATYVLICAQQRLEIALSCAAIGVMNTFLSSFLGDEDHIELSSHFSKELDIQNCIGPSSTVTLCGRLSTEHSEEGEYVVLATAHYEVCESERSSPEMLEVTDHRFNKEAAASAAVLTPTYKDDTAACWYHRITSTKITIDVEGFSKLNVLVPQRSTSSIHPLHPSKNDTIYHIVVNVDHKLGSKIINVQSPLSVCNHTAHALSLYYQKSALSELSVKLIGETVNPFQDLVKVAVIAPNETYCVPLLVAYHSKLFIHPAYMENCSVSEVGLWWKDFDAKPHQEIQCLAKQDTGEVMFSLSAITSKKHESKGLVDNLVPNYLVKLLPPLTIHNYLPISIQIQLPTTNRQIQIETGTSADIYELGSTTNKKIEAKVTSYLGVTWIGDLLINSKTKDKTFQMTSESTSQRFLINTRVYNEENCNLYLFSSHWVVNKCGTPLLLKGASSKELYQLNDEEPVLVNISKNQDMELKVCQSAWSKPFSLNAAGTSGVIICHDHERGNKVYKLHISTTFSQSCAALTKIVTIVPYFVVWNNSRKHLRFMEDNEKADLWIDLAPSKCVPFWPDTTTMRMFVKFRDGKVISQNIPFNWCHTTVLKMDKGCGLTVKVSGGAEAPFTIVFNNFGPGEAPIRIDNLCELVHIKVNQPNTPQNAIVLNPYQSILYTWDDPCKERNLQWNATAAKSKDISLDIWKDGFGVQKVQVLSEQPPSTPPAAVQTSNSSMSSKISAGLRRLSKPSFDAAAKLNDEASETSEIFIYWVSFLESGQRVLLLTTDADTALRTKSMIDPEKGSFELILALTGVGVSLATDPDNPTQELAYVSAQESAPSWEVLVSRGWCPMPFELAAWCEENYIQRVNSAKLKTLMHVDFDKMQLIKPFFAELRRVQNPAIWMQYRRSPRQVYVHWKVHHLQVDNQLPDAQNPTILSPLPSLKGAQQPCFEASMFYQNYNCQTVYKYIRVIFGSFKVDADKAFFSKVLRSLEQKHNFYSLEAKVRADVTFAHQPLGLKQYQVLDHDCLIENLFISPLTIQIRYVPSPNNTELPISQISNKITAFYESLSDIQEEHLFSLRLQSCENYGMSIPMSEMIGSIYKHYSTQAHQQYYASVLGLNVLTNPYDLITDMGIVEGVWRGPQIGGTEPYSEGIAFGAKAMMGYAIGASSWHLVPGCDASENLISHSRKEILNQAEQRVLAPQEILKYEQSLSKAFLGVNGLFYKEKSDNTSRMEVFCKGTGGRFLDMIEAGDIVNPFTSTEYAIRRLIDFGELSMATRIRMPKYTNPYLGFRPFSDYEAIGYNLLTSLIKELNLPNEIYWAHAPLTLDSTSVALITIQRFYVLKKTQLWGSWTVEKDILIINLVSVPRVEKNKLIFTSVKDSDEVCTVETEDALVAEWLQNKIETAMIAAMEEKPCPSTI